MIKVKIAVNGAPKTVIVPPTKKICEAIEENVGSKDIIKRIILDGNPLERDSLIQSFADQGITDNCSLFIITGQDPEIDELPFTDEAPSVKAMIIGSACVITSSLTPEDIRRMKAIHPEQLQIKDETGEPTFAIDIDDDGPGSINRNGAVFGHATTPDGRATITVVLDPSADDRHALVKEKLGNALRTLAEMERRITPSLQNLKNDEQEIEEMILDY